MRFPGTLLTPPNRFQWEVSSWLTERIDLARVVTVTSERFFAGWRLLPDPGFGSPPVAPSPHLVVDLIRPDDLVVLTVEAMTSSSSPANGLDPRQGERHRTTGGAVRLSAHARVRPLRDHPTAEPFTPRRHTSGSLQPAGLRSRRGGARPVQLRWILEAIGRLPMLVHPDGDTPTCSTGSHRRRFFPASPWRPHRDDRTERPGRLPRRARGRHPRHHDPGRSGEARARRSTPACAAGDANRHGRSGIELEDDDRSSVVLDETTIVPTLTGIDLLPSRDQAAAPPTSPPEPADPGVRDLDRSAVPPPDLPKRRGGMAPLIHARRRG